MDIKLSGAAARTGILRKKEYENYMKKSRQVVVGKVIPPDKNAYIEHFNT